MVPNSDAALPRQLDILQVYRGLAATLVVLYHLTWWGGAPTFLQLPFWLPMMPTWKWGGFFLFGHSGVDFFFTLSGFVMVWGYGRDAGKIGRLWGFVKGRFTRIYPTYWVVFLLTLAYYVARPGLVDPIVYTEPDGLPRLRRRDARQGRRQRRAPAPRPGSARPATRGSTGRDRDR